MRSRGPLITLLVGLALAGVLITLSMNATRRSELAAGSAEVPAASGNASADLPADNAPGNPGNEAPDPVETPAPGATGDPERDGAGQNGAGQNGASAAPAGKQEVTWAGRVKGGAATIAITARGNQAIAYVCDGERIEAWLQGTATGGKLNLSAGARSTIDASLTGTFGNGRAKGTVRVGGTSFTFDVGAVTRPSGLYRASADVRGAKLVGGWIVLADGTQVGLATFAGSVVPVEPLDLPSGTVTLYGARITARPATPGAA